MQRQADSGDPIARQGGVDVSGIPTGAPPGVAAAPSVNPAEAVRAPTTPPEGAAAGSVPLVGTLLENRYRVDSLIARGGMSTVYRGLDTRLDRPVAIKVMDQRLSGQPAFVDRFVKEARTVAKLHHPNVVAVHDQGVDRRADGDQVFLVMELITGGTLRDVLRERGRLTAAEALGVLEPVLSALAAAHRAELVHRDVKPENVLISSTGVVKVADFGLVRAISDSNATSDQLILGTVAYLSPEQVATGQTNARSDVYSAGVVLYEMLTGVPPFGGDSPMAVAYKHVNEDVPLPSTILPSIPPALDELVEAATRRDPRLRPADAADFLTRLRRASQTLGVERVATPVPEAAASTSPGVTSTPSADPAPGFTGTSAPPTNSGAAPPMNATKVWARMPEGQPSGYARFAEEPVTEVIPATRTGVAAERRRDRKAFLIWVTAIVLLGAGIAGLAWYLGGAARTEVPQVRGMERAAAAQALTDRRFVPEVTNRFDDTIAEGKVIGTEPKAGNAVEPGSVVKVLISIGKPKVPNIAPGTEIRDAEEQIRQALLEPKRGGEVFDASVPKGRVSRLDPPPGTQLRTGAQVNMIISKGRPPTPVPDLVGVPRDQAFQILIEQGFQPFDLGAEFSTDADGGSVARTEPDEGEIPADGRVGVVISNSVKIPNVIGQDAQQAAAELRQRGLNVRFAGFAGGGRGDVIATFPLPGSFVRQGESVTIRTLF